MRKIVLSILGLIFGLAIMVAKADTYKLSDGASLTGDIVKFDDTGIMLHLSEDNYTNVQWARFSQDSLQQLAQNPKITQMVEPFIEPTQTARPPKPEIHVQAVSKLDLPPDRSVIGGIFKSSLGIFLLLVVYGANLFAASEVAVIKARPPAQVVGAAAILPVIAPVIFLWLPMLEQKAPEQAVPEEVFPEGEQTPEQIQIVEASWTAKAEEKKLEPQIFPRGKFTFNKRFVETKFASYMGDGKSGDAAKYTMELRTSKDMLTVERIMQVAAAEMILETVQRGQITVALLEIQEIKLNPKAA